MESLNSYASDGESDSSSNMAVSKKPDLVREEADANCEPITMDMSEDSSSGYSDGGKNESADKLQTRYSRSLSPSPATSYSSRGSGDSGHRKCSKANDEKERRRHSSSERSSSKSSLVKDGKRCDDYKRKHDREYKRDDDRDRRRRDRRDKYSDRDADWYSSKRHERKRSHRSRSRSPSYSKHRSHKRKAKSRSRSRSYERYQRRSSPKRSKRRSPYRPRRSRSKSPVREKPRPYDWKSTSKLKVLEKLGIELKVPPGGIEAVQAAAAAAAAATAAAVATTTTASTTSIALSNPGQLTPQLLLQKTMEEQVEKVKSATGIALPSYYNPIAVNPSKYAEQIQKRRLLWGNKDKQSVPAPSEEKTANKETEHKGSGTIWQGATFGGDQDGKMSAKFQRLMGIKNVSQDAPPEVKANGSDLIKKQEEMFHSMESQYEVARLATHSHRGLGLGFGTFQPR